MSEQAGQPNIIDHVPGMEPPVETTQIRGGDIVPIDPADVTDEMRQNAIGSPDRVGAGVLRTPEMQVTADVRAENAADLSVAATVEVVPSETAPAEQLPAVNEYDKLFAPDSEEEVDVEAAAVRSDRPLPSAGEQSIIAQRVRQQMAINAADRANRQAAGLPPRTYDLR